MRFCSLKTYLSIWRQLIVFHPTVFGFEVEGRSDFPTIPNRLVESVLGIFATTGTFTHRYIASHVCEGLSLEMNSRACKPRLSWALPHPFSGIIRWFGLGICFLTHLSQPHHSVLTKPTSLTGDETELLRSCISLLILTVGVGEVSSPYLRQHNQLIRVL